MRVIFNLVRNHLQILFRDRATLIQGFAVPVILMIALGAAIGEEQAISVTLLVDVVNEDGSEFSEDFVNALQQAASSSDAVIFCVYGAENNPSDCDLASDKTFTDVGAGRLEDLTTSAAVIIPDGFGASVDAGEPANIEYRSDTAFNNQTVARTTVETALTRFNASLAIAQQGVDTVETYFEPYADSTVRLTDYNLLVAEARTELASPAAVVNANSGEEQIIAGVGTRQSVPGQGAMFVMFSLLGIATIMVEERNNGTFQRLLIVPAPKTYIVVGKILGVFTFGMLQFAIFVVFGAIIGVDWGSDYIALFILIAAYCLAGTALGFLVSTFTRTANQAATAINMLGLTLAPLGGAWWPLFIVPDFMQTIGHLSPIAWVMDGFYELLYYNGTIVDVLPMIGALMVFTAIFTTLGVMRFRY